MRTSLIALILVAPLAATGCKKKAPEPTVQAPPPAAAVTGPTWTWGVAQYSGGHSADDVGTMTYNVVVANNTDKALIISKWDLGTTSDAGRLCIARGDTLQKANVGETISLALAGDCQFANVPNAEELTVKGQITYALSGEETVKDVTVKLEYKQN